MSESGRGDSAKLLDYVSQTQLRLANFILKHLWPTPFVLDHCVKNITECDEEDSAGKYTQVSAHLSPRVCPVLLKATL